MKIIVTFFCILILSFFPASAESYNIDEDNSVRNSLDEKTGDFLDKNGIDIENDEWIKNITPENVFKHIGQFLKNGMKIPLKSGVSVLAIVLISAAISAIGEKGAYPAAIYATTIATSGILISPVYLCISAATSALKGCSTFMLSFVPIFAAVATASGNLSSAMTMGGLLLAASEVVGIISSFFILPLMSAYLAVGICSAASPLSNGAAAAESIKKIAFWLLSLISTVFLGILSIQTTVSAATDSLSIRTSKFLIGTTVPVAGATVSEAITTVAASMGLIKSTVGIYGIVAITTIFLPIILEILIWRVVLAVLNIISSFLNVSKIDLLFKSVDAMFSFLIGIILLICAVFIISLAVIITVGKAQ